MAFGSITTAAQRCWQSNTGLRFRIYGYDIADTVATTLVYGLPVLVGGAFYYAYQWPQQVIASIPAMIDGNPVNCTSFDLADQFSLWSRTGLAPICSGFPEEDIAIRGSANEAPELGIIYIGSIALIGLALLAAQIRAGIRQCTLASDKETLRKARNEREQAATEYTEILSDLQKLILTYTPAIAVLSYVSVYRYLTSLSIYQNAFGVKPVSDVFDATVSRGQVVALVHDRLREVGAQTPELASALWETHNSLNGMMAGQNNEGVLQSALAQVGHPMVKAVIGDVLMGDAGSTSQAECDFSIERIWGNGLGNLTATPLYTCNSPHTNIIVTNVTVDGYPLPPIVQGSVGKTYASLMGVAGESFWLTVFFWMMTLGSAYVALRAMNHIYRRTAGKDQREPQKNDPNRSRNKGLAFFEWWSDYKLHCAQSQDWPVIMARIVDSLGTILKTVYMYKLFPRNYENAQQFIYNDYLGFVKKFDPSIYTYGSGGVEAFLDEGKTLSVNGGLGASEIPFGLFLIGAISALQLVGSAFVMYALPLMVRGVKAASSCAKGAIARCRGEQDDNRQSLLQNERSAVVEGGAVGDQQLNGVTDGASVDSQERTSCCDKLSACMSMVGYGAWRFLQVSDQALQRVTQFTSYGYYAMTAVLAVVSVKMIVDYDTQYCDYSQVCPDAVFLLLMTLPSMIPSRLCTPEIHLGCMSDAVINTWKTCVLVFAEKGLDALYAGIGAALSHTLYRFKNDGYTVEEEDHAKDEQLVALPS